MRTFILSDESVNSYGFRVLTDGISIADFEKNPVMLWNHGRSYMDNKDTILPIGHWENIRKEGDKLLADANFDMDDEFAAKIARKVERKDINACSICFGDYTESDDPADLVIGQTRNTVKTCSLMEVSICDIPSNKNAISMYKDGVKVELTTKGDCPIGLITNNKNESEMDLKTLSEKLGLAENATEADVMKSIVSMSAEIQSLKQQLEQSTRSLKELKESIAQTQKAEADALISEAMKDGRIDAAGKTEFEKLFANDFEMAKRMLGMMSPRTKLTDMLKKETLGDCSYSKLSWDEIDRQNKLQDLHDNYPDLYEQKYNEKFKKN